MRTYRLTFDIEIPDDISNIDKEEFESWLDHFKDYTESDIYSCCPHGGMDVNGNWEEI